MTDIPHGDLVEGYVHEWMEKCGSKNDHEDHNNKREREAGRNVMSLMHSRIVIDCVWSELN